MPLSLGINLAKNRSCISSAPEGNITGSENMSRLSKYLSHAEVTICISIPGQGRLNLGLLSVTLSQRFSLVKELKNILIGPFEFVCYLHTIHSVKLTKIVGVGSSQCNLVLAPNQKLLATPLIQIWTLEEQEQVKFLH